MQTKGVCLIAAERKKQQGRYPAEGDVQTRKDESLAALGAFLASPEGSLQGGVALPAWACAWIDAHRDKLANGEDTQTKEQRIRELTIAGAFIAAEIDRLLLTE